MLAVLGVSGCASTPSYMPAPDVDSRVRTLMTEHSAASVGIGILRRGKLVWSAYYGESAPGVPTGPDTLFNTASVNKAITAETALRLASTGLISLDEPISKYYVHPDIADDPRHRLLTPRLLLSHQAGFMNWPFNYDDGKLAFIDEPGNSQYHYAGIGVRIFAYFLEAKLNKPFPDIVRETVLDPVGMTRTTNSHDIAQTRDHVVVPVDASGNFLTDSKLETDYWSAADDLFTTVPEYAQFLAAVYRNDSVSALYSQQRQTVETPFADDPIWGCGEDAVDPCPSPYGHSIGWFLFGDNGQLTLHHGGNDKSEGAIGYIDPATGNGGIVFVNSTDGLKIWPKVVDIVDPDQPFHDVFHDLIRRFLSD